MSPRLWLLLFVLTLAIGVTVMMSKAKTSAPVEEDVSAVATEKKAPEAPFVPPPVDPEPLPVAPKKSAGGTDKRNDSNGLPAPSESVPNYEAERTRPPGTTQPPNPEDPYNNAPVDGGPGNLSNNQNNPPTSYPPPAYPPPVYPDGGFEGDVPPPPGTSPEGNPDGFGEGDVPPGADEGF